MSEQKVTSSAVAKRAGVSQSAVSRVFTPGASASVATKEKVIKAASELGYRPNRLARGLITGRTRMIGLVVAYLDNQFYPLALEGLSQALQEKGYHILVFMAKNTPASVTKVVQELIDYQVDGIIAASVAVSGDLAKRCAKAGIPIVLFNRGQDESKLSEVTSDNIAGGRSVANFLVAGGHKQIAHISGWQGSSTGRDRAVHRVHPACACYWKRSADHKKSDRSARRRPQPAAPTPAHSPQSARAVDAAVNCRAVAPIHPLPSHSS